MYKELCPSVDEVNRYLDLWNSFEKNVLLGNSLEKLFFETYPHNTDISEILVKASALNTFSSTNIFSILPVAKHILELDIDERLRRGDERLVNEIAHVDMEGTKRNFYSFATKYCSHHYPNLYPIYDSYVEKVLVALMKKDSFSRFVRRDLKDYGKFKAVIIDFRNFYCLDEFSLKEIDRYLWQIGREYFPLKY